MVPMLTMVTIIVSKPAIILASQSPRRRALLAEAGYEFEVCSPPEEAESDSGVES